MHALISQNTAFGIWALHDLFSSTNQAPRVGCAAGAPHQGL